MEGFLAPDYGPRYKEARRQLSAWLATGALKPCEHIHEGFENIPRAFLGLFHGANTGKAMVKLADVPDQAIDTRPPARWPVSCVVWRWRSTSRPLRFSQTPEGLTVTIPRKATRMPSRNAFKTNASFFRMLALGAVGAQTVQQHLNELGHRTIELERGALSTKIWRDVKRKRVRIPDLCCTSYGVRIESRAKTSPDLRMSHSTGDAERAWDYGMLDSDWGRISNPVAGAGSTGHGCAGFTAVALARADSDVVGGFGAHQHVQSIGSCGTPRSRRLARKASPRDRNSRSSGMHGSPPRTVASRAYRRVEFTIQPRTRPTGRATGNSTPASTPSCGAAIDSEGTRSSPAMWHRSGWMSAATDRGAIANASKRCCAPASAPVASQDASWQGWRR